MTILFEMYRFECSVSFIYIYFFFVAVCFPLLMSQIFPKAFLRLCIHVVLLGYLQTELFVNYGTIEASFAFCFLSVL